MPSDSEIIFFVSGTWIINQQDVRACAMPVLLKCHCENFPGFTTNRVDKNPWKIKKKLGEISFNEVRPGFVLCRVYASSVPNPFYVFMRNGLIGGIPIFLTIRAIRDFSEALNCLWITPRTLVLVEGLRECGSSKNFSSNAAFTTLCRPRSKSCFCVAGNCAHKDARNRRTFGCALHQKPGGAGSCMTTRGRACIKSAGAFTERSSARIYLPSPLL